MRWLCLYLNLPVASGSRPLLSPFPHSLPCRTSLQAFLAAWHHSCLGCVRLHCAQFHWSPTFLLWPTFALSLHWISFQSSCFVPCIAWEQSVRPIGTGRSPAAISSHAGFDPGHPAFTKGLRENGPSLPLPPIISLVSLSATITRTVVPLTLFL